MCTAVLFAIVTGGKNQRTWIHRTFVEFCHQLKIHICIGQEILNSGTSHVLGYISAFLSALLPQDCQDILWSGTRDNGVYTIYPRGTGGFRVYCDMKTAGGGWTVVWIFLLSVFFLIWILYGSHIWLLRKKFNKSFKQNVVIWNNVHISQIRYFPIKFIV